LRASHRTVGRAAADDKRPNTESGIIFHRVTRALLPALRAVPNPRVAQFASPESIGWVLSVDNRLVCVYVSAREKSAGDAVACARPMPAKSGRP